MNLTEQKSKILIIFVGFVMLILNAGIWLMPNINMQYMVSQNLLQVPFQNPNAHYIFYNYLEPLLFWILQGRTLKEYILFTFLVTLLFTLTYMLWFLKYHQNELTNHPFKLLLALSFPVFFITYYWVGMDGMTLLFILLVLINNKKSLALLFAFLLGLQHFEQGFIAFGLLLATIILKKLVEKEKLFDEHSIYYIRVVILLIVAKLSLSLFFSFFDVGLSGARDSYMKEHMMTYITMWKQNWYMILWSFFGVGWVVIIRFYRQTWILFPAITIVLFFTAIVGDQTRVGVILLFPTLFHFILANRVFWKNVEKEFAIGLVFLYLLIPISVVWGTTHTSLISQSTTLLSTLIHDKHIDAYDWTHPFKKDTKNDRIIKQLSEYKFEVKIVRQTISLEQSQNLVQIPIEIKNIGEETWPSSGKADGRYAVRLTYKILSDNTMVDGLRSDFPHDIASGVSIPMSLKVKPNLPKGKYTLQVDLVHEGVRWFSTDSKPLHTITMEIL